MKSNRFSLEVRNADNKLVESVGGYSTRAAAEVAARAKRTVIQRNGWNMRVYTNEAHLVSQAEGGEE